MNVENWPIENVKPYENNPRKNDDAVEYVANSIREFGFQQPLVVDSEGVLVVGHTRLKASQKLGLTEVPVVVADGLTDEQVKAYRLADNKTNEFAEWDFPMLNEELEGIDWLEINMEQFGFQLDDELFGEAEEDDYTEEQAQEAPSRVKKGEIWQLGEHRLMCGDATKYEDCLLLMDGREVYMVLTDPPYNMISVPSKKGLFEKELNKLKNSIDAMVDFDPSPFIDCLKKIIGNKFAVYIFCNAPLLYDYLGVARQLSIPPKVLIWDKKTAIPIRKCYFSDVEYIVYFQKNATFNSSIEGIKYSRVLEFQRDNKKEAGGHPTPKPIPLLKNIISISSNKGDTVLDLFGGSGSTLIACEQLNRKCYMMELDPHYCDVIVDRWEKLTGREAVRLEP